MYTYIHIYIYIYNINIFLIQRRYKALLGEERIDIGGFMFLINYETFDEFIERISSHVPSFSNIFPFCKRSKER